MLTAYGIGLGNASTYAIKTSSSNNANDENTAIKNARAWVEKYEAQTGTRLAPFIRTETHDGSKWSYGSWRPAWTQSIVEDTPTDPIANQGAGDQGRGGGAAGQAGAGSGEEGSLQFKYRLVGWNQSTKGEQDLKSSSFVYGSAEDAIAGGRQLGDNDPEVIRIYAAPSIIGFAGKQYTYTDRYAAAWSAENEATGGHIANWPGDVGTYDTGAGAGADNAAWGSGGPSWLIIAVIVIIIIAAVAFYIKGAG